MNARGLIRYDAVTLDGTLCFLMGRTNSPSTMGAQLEAAQACTVDEPGGATPSKSKNRKATKATHVGVCPVCQTPTEIGQIVSGKVHLRCYGEKFVHEGMHLKPAAPDGAQAREMAELRIPRDIPTIRCLDALCAQRNANGLKVRKGLARLHRAVVAKDSDRTQGELTVQCLRAYEEFRLRSAEQGLAAVYRWANRLAPEQFSVVLHTESDLAQAFRTGQAKNARTQAAELYADCYLVLAEWIVSWNRGQMVRVA